MSEYDQLNENTQLYCDYSEPLLTNFLMLYINLEICWLQHQRFSKSPNNATSERRVYSRKVQTIIYFLESMSFVHYK